MNYSEKYQEWLHNADDNDIQTELKNIYGLDEEIKERFYKDLEFGTGGLRGVIGAGTNRMNIYTVGRATQGFCNYLNSTYSTPKVAIAYDSRIKSDIFAIKTAQVFAANGIKVYLYSELMPTPMLSFAVRYLKCDAGVVVTASHNPSKYNGYKAYGPDGCQLNLEASNSVIEHISKVDIFNDIKSNDFETALNNNQIEYISENVIEAYLSEVYSRSVNESVLKNSNLKVIYTPLHGSGNKPVRAILNKAGAKNIIVVPEQELPDGNFPTAPYPNPEIKEAFECALNLAKNNPADLLLATDPDADRVGIAVNHNDEYVLMSGNEVGALLLNYILSNRQDLSTTPTTVKTIVTSDIAQKIADKHNCKLVNVLTGFKFIGDVIAKLEAENKESDFVFGFEESYGYLSGSYVRDKDAVVASMLICEMAAYYKSQNKTLVDVMNQLYEKYGYYCNKQTSFVCEGISGMERMNEIMDSFRTDPPKEIYGFKVERFNDYLRSVSLNLKDNTESKIDLPSSNVIEFMLENSSKVIIRPSGTEPKIKVYIEAISDNREDSLVLADCLKERTAELMGF